MGDGREGTRTLLLLGVVREEAGSGPRPAVVIEDGESEFLPAELISVTAGLGFEIEEVVGRGDVEVDDMEEQAVSEVDSALESALWVKAVDAEEAVETSGPIAGRTDDRAAIETGADRGHFRDVAVEREDVYGGVARKEAERCHSHRDNEWMLESEAHGAVHGWTSSRASVTISASMSFFVPAESNEEGMFGDTIDEAGDATGSFEDGLDSIREEELGRTTR